MRRKVNPDIRKIKGANGKTLSQEEQRHLSELLDFAQKQEHNASPLDIYRDLFSMEVRKSGMEGIMSIRLFDDSEHTRKMSPCQSAWYFNSPESEREDVAIRIAATMFSTEIFESVLLKYPVSDIGSSIRNVNIIKMREGSRAIRVVSSDGFSAEYQMTTEELRCHARLQGEAANGYLHQLAILCITHEDATELANRIKELTAKSTGSTILPLRQSDYTADQAKAFTTHQSPDLSRLMPRDTSSTHSAHREWEVSERPRYDHIDNQQSGTQLTM